MRVLKPILLLAGLVLVGVLVYRVGAAPIVETLGRLTWWQFVLVCVPYGVISAVDTLGWRYAFTRDKAPFHRLLGARLAGEAVNLVAAVGSVGGEAVKAWLVRRDVSYEESVPAVVIAKTTITMAQALFLLIGIVLAVAGNGAGSSVLSWMLWLLVVEVLAVSGFVGAQVAGLVARGGRVLRWFGLVETPAYAEVLDRALRRYYCTEWRRFALSTGFHLAGWLLGAIEALVILIVLGVDATALTAVVIEALDSGVRFATFLIPANLGAEEAANAVVFQAMGFGAGAGLAFSFVRRARQVVWIVIGILILLVMRWHEKRAG